VVKAPSIHREDSRVAVACHGERAGRAGVQDAYEALTGYALEITMVDRPPGTSSAAVPSTAAPAGEPLEINAAYAAVREALAGSTLYRTSLKDGRIVLSFVSKEVGARYREAIEALAEHIGWPLEINPNPNQGEILAAAQSLLATAGLTALRGPGLHIADAEVRVGLAPAALPAADDPARRSLEDAFHEQTGYRLVLEAITAPGPSSGGTATATARAEVIEIPLARIQLSEGQRAQPLDPDKTRRAVDRARRQGGALEPIVVRRLAGGYRLVDGLRRLEVAKELGLDAVPAVVEE
jgi:hypothetical protein